MFNYFFSFAHEYRYKLKTWLKFVSSPIDNLKRPNNEEIGLQNLWGYPKTCRVVPQCPIAGEATDSEHSRVSSQVYRVYQE